MRFALSLQQEFLRLIDHGDEFGPFGPYYHIVGGWRLNGPLVVDTLQDALNDLVDRHEALRTEIVIGDDAGHQQVHPPMPVRLRIRDLSRMDTVSREHVAQELVNEIEAGTFEMDQLPAITAVLGRFDAEDWVLVLAAHHTAVDGWSMQVIVRDLAELYAARHHGQDAKLPVPGQYRQFVEWQEAEMEGRSVAASREYWRETLRGAQITPVTTDKPRGDGAPSPTSYHRFLLPEQLRTLTLEVAGTTRSSPFMVMFAAYAMLLHRRTGLTDIVAPTFTPGRQTPWSVDTVGSFYNFIPLRINLAGCASFRELISRTRSACLSAYANEIPFSEIIAEAPELLVPIETDMAACILLQVVQSPFIMTDEFVGEIRYTAMRRRLIPQHCGSAIPDGALWNMELHPPGIVGSIGFISGLFQTETMVDLVAEFSGLLENVLSDLDQGLD